MAINKNKIVTQNELPELAPIDKAEDRVQKELTKLKRRAKEQVARGLEKQASDSKGRRRTKKVEKTSH